MGTRINSRQQAPIRSLLRQGSLYSLTLNEVQSHLGEPLHGMKLDNLLKNIFAAEGSNPYSSSDIDSPSAQLSSTMNLAMNKRTVDEVWRDIQQKASNDGRSSNQTLGEMTLEDFLTKAGVVAEDVGKTNSGVCDGFAKGPHWMIGAYGSNHSMPQPLGVGAGAIVEALSDPQCTPGRKRGPGEEFEENTVERRQKRMIKNRESAARSRARKQAYTNELENKVSRLEEENERLRKEKELDMLVHSAPPPEQKCHLRRSISAPFSQCLCKNL